MCRAGGQAARGQQLDVVSFNIQFLGHFKDRDDTALAALLTPFDIAVIQEPVAPPFEGTFPDGTPYRPDTESRRFFEAMESRGFDFILSTEDTNFVLIPVHLQPGESNADRSRRRHELRSIADWVADHDAVEQDFFILGDMNFEDCAEIEAILPSGYQALNQGADCKATNTNVDEPRPYDNVLLTSSGQGELVDDGQFAVLNLIQAMRVPWYEDSIQSYPGDAPYDHNAFRVRYSDHQPVRFRLQIDADDD